MRKTEGEGCHNQLHDLSIGQFAHHRRSPRQLQQAINQERMHLVVLADVVLQLIGAQLLEETAAPVVTFRLKIKNKRPRRPSHHAHFDVNYEYLKVKVVANVTALVEQALANPHMQ